MLLTFRNLHQHLSAKYMKQWADANLAPVHQKTDSWNFRSVLGIGSVMQAPARRDTFQTEVNLSHPHPHT